MKEHLEYNKNDIRKTKDETGFFTTNKEFEKQKLKESLLNENNIIKENFEFMDIIGSGSEGVVYKALHKKSRKELAIKILKEKERNNNLREIFISLKLKNKNIINYFCKGDSNCIIDFILMELAKYGSLKEFKNNVLKRNYLSEQFLCFITFQILNGLKYNHKCKIAHLDIKLQNIVINEFLNVKLIDYSVALDYSKIKSKTIKLPFCGTKFYMAPEVIKEKVIDVKDLNKVDLYSLGIVLYYLAFGTYPFDLNSEDTKSYDKIYEKITTNDLKIENDMELSKHFIDFLNRLLEKDIKKRININEAMNHYWVKGANILFDEKDKLYNAGTFLSYLITDYFKSFNDYIKE